MVTVPSREAGDSLPFPGQEGKYKDPYPLQKGREKPNAKRIIVSRVRQRVNASQLGRSFDIKDDEGREEFADWLIELLDRLGLGTFWVPEDIEEDRNAERAKGRWIGNTFVEDEDEED